MTLIKGPNGLVVDIADEVASGLVAGGHAEYVLATTEPVKRGRRKADPEE